MRGHPAPKKGNASKLGDERAARNATGKAHINLAKALGCHSQHVTQIEELRPAIKAAFASGKPACINVKIASIPSPSNVG